RTTNGVLPVHRRVAVRAADRIHPAVHAASPPAGLCAAESASASRYHTTRRVGRLSIRETPAPRALPFPPSLASPHPPHAGGRRGGPLDARFAPAILFLL